MGFELHRLGGATEQQRQTRPEASGWAVERHEPIMMIVAPEDRPASVTSPFCGLSAECQRAEGSDSERSDSEQGAITKLKLPVTSPPPGPAVAREPGGPAARQHLFMIVSVAVPSAARTVTGRAAR